MRGDVGGGADAVRYAVLGPLEVRSADGELLAVGGSKQRALLSLLVLYRNRAVSPSRLVVGLWGEDPPRGAEVTLRSHVSHLRRRLAAAAVGDTLTTGPAGYSLAVAENEVDVGRFEEQVGLAQEALGLGRPQRAASLVREALRLWRGPAFCDLEDVDAAGAEAARLEELRLGAHEVLVAAELASGHHREVVAELEALVEEHPFRERFCAQLMVALYRSGRQAEALQAYATTRARLADELGLDPGPELQALSRRVLQQDPLLLGDPEGSGPSTPVPPVVRRSPARPPDAVFAALARSTLVGRSAELGRLVAAWEAVSGGDHRVVLVSGPAGIGKSHLTARLVDRAMEEGRPVLVGRCDAAELPYEPVATALRSSPAVDDVLDAVPPAVTAELAPVLDARDDEAEVAPGQATPGGSEIALYTAVTVVLRSLAGSGPVLLVIENAERIDRASSRLLRHVMARLPAGVLMVVCFRDPPGGRHPALLPLLGDAAGGVAERVPLGPLGEEDLADLVRPAVPDVDRHAHRLWQHTGGNPFYAKEMASALADRAAADKDAWAVPVGIRDVLRHRLSSLSPASRDVLPVAAVLGASVDVELLAEVTRLPEDEVAAALDDGVAEGLLVESGSSWLGSYAFANDLVREALRSTLTGFRLRALHLGAAEALMSRPGKRSSAAIAAHLRAAGPAADPLEAARFSLAAADEFSAVHAWDEAIEHAEAAVRLLEGNETPGVRADAALRAGMLRLKSGRGYQQGVELLETALHQFLRAGDERSAGVVHSRLGGAYSLHHTITDIPRALEHFDAAERLVPAADTVYHLHRGRAQAAMLGLRTSQLGTSAGRARAIAASLGRRDLMVLPGWALGWAALNEGRVAEAVEQWEGAWGVAHELADPYLGWTPVNGASLAFNAYLLDPETARSWCRRGLGQPRFAAFTDPHGAVVDQLALSLAAMGDLRTAHEAAEELTEDAVARRMLLFLDGQWEQAEAAWAAAAASDEARGDRHDAALNLHWLASARSARGDDPGARLALEQALALAVAGPQVPIELAARAGLARLLSCDGPVPAAEHLARCEQILARGERWYGVVGEVELARAAVAAGTGEHERADDASARAVAVFADHRLAWREAGALESWARLLERRGMPAQARERRHRAHEVYDRIGAPDRWRQGDPS